MKVVFFPPFFFLLFQGVQKTVQISGLKANEDGLKNKKIKKVGK